MGMLQAVKEARETLRHASLAKTDEEKARARVLKAQTKVQLAIARADLKAAQLKRDTEEMRARVALERARAEVNLAKAAQLRSSEAKWIARYSRLQAATAPVVGSAVVATRGVLKGARGAAKGLAKAQRSYYGEKVPTKRKVVKRKELRRKSAK